MAVNKNFVVKNGLEVDNNLIFADATNKRVGIASTTPNYTLNVAGGIGVTDAYVSGFTTLTQDLQVGSSGSIFYISDTNNLVGIGTSLPAYALDIRGPGSGTVSLFVQGDSVTTGITTTNNLTATGFTTLTQDLQVGSSGSIFYISDTNNLVGIGTSLPAYLLDVRTSASVGTTALYVYGDAAVTGNLNVTGDLVYDEVSGRNLDISGIATIATLGVSAATTSKDLLVTGVSTFSGTVDIGVSGTPAKIQFLAATGYGPYIKQSASSINALSVWTNNEERVTITSSGSVGIGTTDPAKAADFTNYTILNAGIVTANYYFGDISNAIGVSTAIHAAVGVSSEGTFIGAGSTIVNFASTNGTAWTVETSGGIATATVTPGASLGMVIALGS